MSFEDTLDLMHGLRDGVRLDQFDYERLGAEEKWSPRATVIMLTSFEMETKGYHQRDDADGVYAKIYAKYKDFVIDWMSQITYMHGPDLPPEIGMFDYDRARFKKEDFINYLVANNRPRVDVDKLKSFLSLEEVPDVTSVARTIVGEMQPELPDDAGERGLPKPKNEKMQHLAILSHRSSDDAKQKIREFVLKEMVSPCTCMSSQMKRHILKLAKDPKSGVTLTYNTKDAEKKISESVLRKLVNATMGKNRIQYMNMRLAPCEKHGQNS